MNKKEFINEVLQAIASKNKLYLVKLVKETSKSKDGLRSMGLKECKEFVDNHMSPNTLENAELLWKFAKGKLKTRT